jgi:hypothetical protein
MLSFTVWFVLALALSSIIEWIVHKEFMHSIRFLRTPHQRHAVMHHSQRRAPGKFFAKAEELKEYHLFETSFMPVLWMLHFPLYATVYYFFGWWASVGIAAGTAAYTMSYEILHWSIHCPDNFWFKNTRWFAFLVENHRRHHNKSNINYNVVLPLADLLLGTLNRSHSVRPEPESLITDDGGIAL